jgi:acyl-CoA reductase-like NAD-dependent aldehyde dehydrogenase
MAQVKSRRVRPKKPPTLTSFNPRTGEVLGEAAATPPDEVAEVVARARKIQPEWGAIPPKGRVLILKEIRHRIYDNLDGIVETVSNETGKPRAEALVTDVLPSVLTLVYYERSAARHLRPQTVGRVFAPLTGAIGTIQWQPFGVVGCISPWNYPFFLSIMAIAPALFAGNCVVLKPSEVTPGVGERLREVLDPLPPGVAEVIQGAGDVGAALVDAPCDKIAFIGSPGTGRKIAEAAAKHLTPVVMELGGKDAAIVCEDADIDVASSGVLWGSFVNAGQTCAAVERIFVHERIADEFTDQLLMKLKRLRFAQQDDGDIGALTLKRQFDTVERHARDAVDKGAQLLAGGADAGPPNTGGSLWFAPTVLEGVTDEMDLAREETFGPLVPIIRVRNDDEAVRRTNEDAFNLTSSVWTKDTEKGRRLASQIRCGAVGINEGGATASGLPFGPWGGVGESGYGRLSGKEGLREFVFPTHVAKKIVPRMKSLWWYPYDESTVMTLRSVVEVMSGPTVKHKLDAVPRLASSLRGAFKSKL